MSEALTAPSLVASLVLCVAGVAKLRAPAPAGEALARAGLPGAPIAIRGFAATELALGAFSAMHPGLVAALALSGVYAGFAGLSWVLAARSSSCGCFGAGDSPASAVQPLLSGAIGLVCAAAAAWPAHDLWWILHHPPIVATVFAIGIGGAVLAIVAAYTQLPAAWTAWSPP